MSSGTERAEHEHSLENVPARQVDDELDLLFGDEDDGDGSEAGGDERSVSGSAEEENAFSDERILNRSPRRLGHASLASKSVEIGPIKRPLDSGYMPYLLKFPGFIQFQSRPLAERSLATTLSEEYPEQDVLDYGDVLKAQTTIRAARGKDSSDPAGLKGNSRLNRWSDGSWTLQIGAVHFEVLPQAFTEDEYNYLYVKQRLDFTDTEKGTTSSEEGMEAVAKLANKLTVRPFTDVSGSHRKYLALAEATGKGMKVTKVRVAATTVDPEKQKQNLIKLQQERTKARRKVDARRKNQQQRAFEKVGREGLSARFLEENEDGEAFYSGEDADEYDADFIDDSEIVEGADSDVDVAGSGSGSEEEDAPDAKPLDPVPSQAKASRTSRLIFDDDDDDDQ
jgi:hypothetical protein